MRRRPSLAGLRDHGDHVWTVLRVVVSAVLLAYVLSTVGTDRLLTNLGRLDPAVLAVALGLAVLNVAISAYKWGLLLRVKGIRLPFATLLRYYYVGQFFNAFLPTMVGGDGARAYYLHAEQDAGPDAVSSVVVERLAGLIAILLLGGAAAIVALDRIPPAAAAAILLVSVPGLLVLLGLLFTSLGRGLLAATVFRVSRFDLGERVAGIYDAIYAYRTAPGARDALLPVLALSLLFRLVLVLNNYVVAVGLGMDVPFVYFLVFVPLVEVLLFLPVSIQGFGVRETSYVYLFGSVGAEAGIALVLGVVMQLVLGVFNNLVGGVVYVVGGRARE